MSAQEEPKEKATTKKGKNAKAINLLGDTAITMYSNKP